jgi:hypothetical protein
VGQKSRAPEAGRRRDPDRARDTYYWVKRPRGRRGRAPRVERGRRGRPPRRRSRRGPNPSTRRAGTRRSCHPQSTGPLTGPGRRPWGGSPRCLDRMGGRRRTTCVGSFRASGRLCVETIGFTMPEGGTRTGKWRLPRQLSPAPPSCIIVYAVNETASTSYRRELGFPPVAASLKWRAGHPRAPASPLAGRSPAPCGTLTLKAATGDG